MPAENDLQSAAHLEAKLTRVLDAMSLEHGGQFFVSMAKVLPQDEANLPYFLARFRMDLFSPELFAHYGIACPPNIRNSVVKRQAEFIAGRLCARSILDAYGEGQHVVAVGSHREPVWPAGFIGSITHSSHYAAAIACKAEGVAGIGIDVETIIKDEARQAMMDMVVNQKEVSYLRRFENYLSFDSLLTLIFSAKESFFKAAFPQVKTYFDFDAVEVCELDLAKKILRFSCSKSLSAGLVQGQISQAYFDLVGATSLFTAVLLPAAVNTDS